MTDAEFEEAADELSRYIKGVVRLRPGVSEATLSSSPQHALSSLTPHIQQHSETYRNFFEKKKGKGK